jgi:hypothetical protein
LSRTGCRYKPGKPVLVSPSDACGRWDLGPDGAHQLEPSWDRTVTIKVGPHCLRRNRSGPTVAATSIECTTSAKSTVTCLYSAGVPDTRVGDPHSSQNFAVGRNSEPHVMQVNAAVMPAE